MGAWRSLVSLERARVRGEKLGIYLSQCWVRRHVVFTGPVEETMEGVQGTPKDS